MGRRFQERLCWKEPLHSLEVELQAEFKDDPSDVGDHPRTGFEPKR